jgi:hypothetical protein
VTEAQELKTQLCAVLTMSNAVAEETDPVGRRLALEHMQRSIQDARHLIETYAVDLLVELED